MLIRREDQRMWAWLLAQSGVDTPSSAVFLISFINLAFRTTDGQKKRLSDAKLTGRHLIFIPTSLDFHIAVNWIALKRKQPWQHAAMHSANKGAYSLRLQIGILSVVGT